jgi:two-component system, chemotaxis family, protein-glutamate methylesterase/glutaminase
MKVLLVEDSRTVRAYVENVLGAAPDVELLPAARDGAQGVELAVKHRPDVILMDLELPVLSGLEAIREIMETAPCPIVVLSGELDKPGVNHTFEAFRAGAVDVLAKPRGLAAAESARFEERLLRTVRVMAEARVLRRKKPSRADALGRAGPGVASPLGRHDVVLIGSSTGGPLVVRGLLDAIAAPFPLPIVICQHIVPGFEHGFARWLSESGHRVSVVDPSSRLEPGLVLVARADKHLEIGAMRELQILPAEAGRPTPSVDILFDSAAAVFGPRCVALLLTGMGADGRRGMVALRKSGALTVTQSAETCVVDGMPGAARAAGASTRDLSPPQMAELLRDVAGATRTNRP